MDTTNDLPKDVNHPSPGFLPRQAREGEAARAAGQTAQQDETGRELAAV
jgi:hypothetical protein